MNFARGRASVALAPLLTFITNTDFLGRTLKPGTVWGEMVKTAIPTPIAGGAVLGVGRQLASGQHSEQFPGQFQKQLMASVGIKSDQAPSPEQRILALASKFNKAHNVTKFGESTPSEYQPLVQALRLSNTTDAKAALDTLMETKTRAAIIKHFNSWPNFPFTGQHAREAVFLKSLTTEEREQYQHARQSRHEVANQVKQLLNQKTP